MPSEDWPFKNDLLALVDADTAAFDAIMAAYGMPKGTDAQKAKRHQAIQDATLNAIDIPLKVAQLAHDALPLAAAMAKDGNPNSVTDAGVAPCACARRSWGRAQRAHQLRRSGRPGQSG